MIFEKGHFRSSRIEKSFINESLKETRTFSAKSAYDTKTTVFLSHKHKDLEEMLPKVANIISLCEFHQDHLPGFWSSPKMKIRLKLSHY